MAKETAYFISTESGPIKIGKAKNVKIRLMDLQISTPEKLSVLGIMRGPLGIEKSLHARFESLRINGEWFRRDSNLLSFISLNTVPLDVTVKSSNELVLKDKIEELTKQLERTKKDLVEEVTLKVVNGVFKGLTLAVRDSMYSAFLNASEIEALFVDIEKNHKLFVSDNYRKQLRKDLSDMCNTDWRSTERLMSLEEHKLYSDETFIALARKLAFGLLKEQLPYELSSGVEHTEIEIRTTEHFRRQKAYARFLGK